MLSPRRRSGGPLSVISGLPGTLMVAPPLGNSRRLEATLQGQRTRSAPTTPGCRCPRPQPEAGRVCPLGELAPPRRSPRPRRAIWRLTCCCSTIMSPTNWSAKMSPHEGFDIESARTDQDPGAQQRSGIPASHRTGCRDYGIEPTPYQASPRGLPQRRSCGWPTGTGAGGLTTPSLKPLWLPW